MAAAALALVIANSGAKQLYFAVLDSHLGPLTILHWVNEGLMAVFFFLVGLEIKRELVDGKLSTWSDRTLPIIAAVAGMVVPALVYVAIAGGTPGLIQGWATPAATDIAFALGVLALLGSRAPASLKLFLTAVAIIDDMGAVAIIALAYTDGMNLAALGAAALVLIALVTINKAGVMQLWPYITLSLALWLAVYLSGVHATVAGVLAALTIPLVRSPGAVDAAASPLHRAERAVHPSVAYLIVPLFGLANAGVSLGGLKWADLLSPLPLAIAAGLFLGKQGAIFGSVRLAVASGLASRPSGASWVQIYGVSMLCGVGFTMSLFIGGLAFDDPSLITSMKIGVLSGSFFSAVTGYLLLAMASAHSSRPSASASVR
jgi:NhaA family Na+:H+ antiporter